MTKNRIRITCIVMVLVMAVLGVVAFADGTQQSRELAARTSGSIDITQLEYERDDTGRLIPFTQDQLLQPVVCKDGFSWTEEVGEYSLWNDAKIENVRDKMVFVRNEADSKAVNFRTVIAMEADQTNYQNLIKYNLNIADYDWISGIVGKTYGDIEVLEGVDINYVYEYTDEQNQPQQYHINGKYNIIVGTYKTVLTPNSVSKPSFLQVAMDSGAGEKQIQQFGDKYEILVCSQAVTVSKENDTVADAFTRAGFGAEITSTNHPWISQDADESTSAINEEIPSDTDGDNNN